MEPQEPEEESAGPAGPSGSDLGKKRKRGPCKAYLRDSSYPIPRTTIQSRETCQKRLHTLGEASAGPNQHEDVADDLIANVSKEPSFDVMEESPLDEELNRSLPEDELTFNPDDEFNYDLPEEERSSDLPDSVYLNLPEEQNAEHDSNATPQLDSPDNEPRAKATGRGSIDYIEKYRLNDPLHQNNPITKLSVLLMILHMAVRHCNTQAFVENKIKFVSTLYGDNVLDVSYYVFKELFKPSSKIIKHYFCPLCQTLVGSSKELQVKTKFVKCDGCGKEVDVYSVDSGNYFISFSCRDQIEALMKKPGIKLIPSAARSTDCISDIYDGELYKKLLKDGFPLSDSNALTVTFNTDGVAIQESTKNSLWPIWFYVNELCPTQRFKTDNLILAGLWFGNSAPNMALFLKPFISELLELATDGVIVEKPDGTIVKCPVFAVCCSVDSVAKAKVMCQKQFNARQGCLYCHHPNAEDKLHRFYDTSVTYSERSEESVVKDMVDADRLLRSGQLKSNEGVNGFLGISVLLMFSKLFPTFSCNTFHIVWSIGIDYMHCLLEGVAGRLLDLYDSILTKENVKILNERIAVITPPQEMTRHPRSFSQRNYWKAKEFRAFILYYALPCLDGLLPEGYYSNLKLFARACHILLGDKISPSELSEARSALEKFTVDFQRLYGLKNVTYNLHLCTHLLDMVLKLGPLWSYSNFVFESGNGSLVRLIREHVP